MAVASERSGGRVRRAKRVHPSVWSLVARCGEALNRNVGRVFNPERKETHWGKRKLKRDQ